MIDAVRIREIAEAQMDGTDLFVVDVRVAPGNGIEVVVDSDTQVGIDRCVALSRAIEASLDREQEAGTLCSLLDSGELPLRVTHNDTKLNNVLFDREQEDFELTVTSAGIGQPLRMLRQYRKLIGREVEVVLKEGGKLVATLIDATGEAITVEYQEKAAVEGKKRKELVTRRRELPLAEVKSTCEHLSFK